MKVVSVLVFAGALIGSWCAVYSHKQVAESVHVGIQNDLRNIITEYVQKNLPDAQNLRFEKMWTETIKPTRVRANFVYTFEQKGENGEPAVLEINGKATLNKVDETPEVATWSLDELKILDNTVNFTEPVTVTAEVGALENISDPSSTPKAEDPTKPKEETHH
jgi:hypothetical protein